MQKLLLAGIAALALAIGGAGVAKAGDSISGSVSGTLSAVGLSGTINSGSELSVNGGSGIGQLSAASAVASGATVGSLTVSLNPAGPAATIGGFANNSGSLSGQAVGGSFSGQEISNTTLSGSLSGNVLEGKLDVNFGKIGGFGD